MNNEAKPVYDITQLGAPTDTVLELKSPADGKTPIGIFIHGHTSDSKEWKRLAKQIMAAPKNEKPSVIINKDNPDERRFELDQDAEEKRRDLCCQAVTNMTGNARYQYTPETFREMYMDPRYNWMHEQWSEYIDDRAEYFLELPEYVEPSPSVEPGSQQATNGEPSTSQPSTTTQPE